MRPFLALLGLSFKSLLINTMSLGRRGKKRTGKSGVGAFILLAALMVYLSAIYSVMLASAFSALGALDVMMLMMTAMALVWPLIFILFAAQSLVFGTKDVDLVMSLPVSSFAVMLSRVLALYLEALLMCEMMLIPAGIVYLMFGGAGGVGFVVLLAVEGLFLALIPTTVSLVLGSLVSLVVARLPFKNLFTVLFSLVFIVGMMALSFSFSFSFSGTGALALNPAGLRGAVAGAFPPLLWALKGALGGFGWLLLLAAVCTAPFLLVTWLFSLIYKRLLTLLASHKLKTNYKLGRLGATGSFRALLGKEARKFFGTPVFLLNSGIGTLLVVIGSVVALFNKNAITGFLASLTGMGGGMLVQYLAPLLLAVMLFFGSMTYISAVSISLEGKTLWILKEAPLSTGRIFTAKAGFNFLVCAFSALLCIPMLGVAFSLPAGTVLLMLLVALLYPLLTSVLGLFINLLLPRMDAENETIIVKQSASVIVTMLADFAILAVLIVGYVLLNGAGFAFEAIAGLASLLLALLCGLALLLLKTKGVKLFA